MAEIEYEPRDVDVRSVLKAGAGLAGITLFGAAAAFGAFLLLGRLGDKRERPVPPLAHEAGRLPPEPRLQSAPQTDLEELRARERKRLSTYGWVTAPGGAVHIPIAEAMRLYAERSAATAHLPAAAPDTPAPPAAGSAPR